jgi:hypothetical protein
MKGQRCTLDFFGPFDRPRVCDSRFPTQGPECVEGQLSNEESNYEYLGILSDEAPPGTDQGATHSESGVAPAFAGFPPHSIGRGPNWRFWVRP